MNYCSMCQSHYGSTTVHLCPVQRAVTVEPQSDIPYSELRELHRLRTEAVRLEILYWETKLRQLATPKNGGQDNE